MTSVADEPLTVIYGLSCSCHPEKGVRYVGQTINGAPSRLGGHLSDARVGSKTPVHMWIRKHGEENIRTRILDTVSDPAALSPREIHWIAKLGTYRGKHGLNMTIGGEGVNGLVCTDDMRARMSASAKARGMGHITQQARLKALQGEANWAAVFTDEFVTAIKQLIWEGEPVSEIADAVGVSMSAINHIKSNRTWTHVPWPIGPARKPRASVVELAQWAKPHTPEAIEKMRASQIAAWTPERKEKASVAFSGANNPMYGVKWDEDKRRETILARGSLSVEEVREIRRLRREEGIQYKDIAVRIDRPDVSTVTIGAVVRRVKYALID